MEMKLKMKRGNDIDVGMDESYLKCVFVFHEYMTLGLNIILDTFSRKFYRLQLYCMIVLIYGCGIQLPMRYQMFSICLYLRMWNPTSSGSSLDMYICIHVRDKGIYSRGI
jgi:hypothetical protein